MKDYFLFSLACILYIAPFSFVKYYIFRDKLALSSQEYLYLYEILLTGELLFIWGAAQPEPPSLALLYSLRWYSVLLYSLFSLAIVQRSPYRQLVCWCMLTAYAVAVWQTAELHRLVGGLLFSGVNELLLFDIGMVVILLVSLPLVVSFIDKQLRPLFLLTADDEWRWGAGGLLLLTILLIIADSSGYRQTVDLVLEEAMLLLLTAIMAAALIGRHSLGGNKAMAIAGTAAAQYGYSDEYSRQAGQIERILAVNGFPKLLLTRYAINKNSLSNEEIAELNIRFNELDKRIKQANYYCDCQNDVLNAIVVYYGERAKARYITFSAAVVLNNKTGIADLDMGIIFCLLLEYGLKCSIHLPLPLRWLNFRAQAIAGRLLVGIDVPCLSAMAFNAEDILLVELAALAKRCQARLSFVRDGESLKILLLGQS